MTIAGEHEEQADVEVMSPIGLSRNRYPTGWFQVGWTAELAPGEVRPIHYFGRELVLWRSEEGVATVSDAYCLHLGAHLGHGGKVQGEQLACPWHGWVWDQEGRNTHIPFSEQECKKNLRLEMWPTMEQYGCILVWHDTAGGPPTWTPVRYPELEDGSHFPLDPARNHSWVIKAHPQMLMENGVDAFHIPFIHGAGAPPTIESVEVDGHRWTTHLTVPYGAGKESTWLTPDGEVQASMRFELEGVGMGVAVWPALLLDGRMITNPTPIDEDHTEVFWAMTVARGEDEAELPRGALKMMEHQKAVVEMDFVIFANMKVGHIPNFAPEEAQHYAHMRRWAWQFYPGSEALLDGIRSAGATGSNGAGA